MLEEKHNIDKLFSDKLSDYQDDIPELNFEKIQNNLEIIKLDSKFDNLFSDKLFDYQEDVPISVFENIKDKINQNLGQNKIDNLFFEYLNNYKETPPDYVLPQIKNKLNNKNSTYTLQKIAATIAILIAFGLGYFTSEVKDNNFKAYSIFSDSIFGQKKDTTNKSSFIKKETPIFKTGNKKLKDSIKTNINSNIESEVSFVENKTIDSNSFLSDFKDLAKNVILEKDKTDSTKNDKEINYKQLLTKGSLIADGSNYNNNFAINSKENKKSRWTFGTRVSPVFSFSNNNSKTKQTDDNLELVSSDIDNEHTSDVSQPEITSVAPAAVSARNTQVEQNSNMLKTANVQEIAEVEFEEQSIAAFTSGLNVNFKISKRWSVQSGLYYSNKKQISKNLTSSTSFYNDNEMLVYTPAGEKYIEQPTNTNDIKGTNIIAQNTNETYHSLDMNYVSNFKYIELPILFKFKIIDKKIDLELLSGISTNFLVGNNSSIMVEEKEVWKGVNEGMSPLLYDATFGFGLNYNFYNSFNFSLEPTFKYNLVKQNVNVQTYPYSFGVFAGFSYTF